MNFPVDYFTGNGTSTIFNLSQVPASATAILVHIGGVKQVASPLNPAYYVNGNQLVFSAPPANNSPIEVEYLGILGQVNVPANQSITPSMLSLQVSNSFTTLVTANGAQTSFTLVAPPTSAAALIVSANGIIQYDYTVSGSTLNLNFTPPAGTIIRAQAMGLAQFNSPNNGSVTSASLVPNIAITNLTVGSSGSALTNTDVYDLDDVSYKADGFTNSFNLTYNQNQVTFPSPFNLDVSINGLIQPGYVQKYDTIWLANIPSASKGYTIDTSGNPTTNNYIKFADCPPAGAQIQIRTRVGSVPANPKIYPFKPLDISMGY